MWLNVKYYNSLSMEEVQRNEHILEKYFVPLGLSR